jgi:hypothetical protein
MNRIELRQAKNGDLIEEIYYRVKEGQIASTTVVYSSCSY